MNSILNKKTLADIDFKDKRVIVRLDFNVPLKDGQVVDPKRITAALPTLQYLLDNNCKIIVLSHLSRIKSLDDINSNKKSLAPVATKLQSLLPNVNVKFLNKNTGVVVDEAAKSLLNKEILLLENTRYNDVNAQNEVVKLESKCDSNLGKYWASLADIFVNDAFGTAHRKHASNVGIAQHIQTSCLGLLIQRELENLSRITNNPTKPVVAILGGAKVSDKLKVINNLLKIADKILICGGMAYTFLKAKGFNIGKSLLEQEMLEEAKHLLEIGKDKIVLPADYQCAAEFADAKPQYHLVGEDIGNLVVLDIGPKTVEIFNEVLESAGTVFWNGPAGVFEFKHFQYGTVSICQMLKSLKSKGVFTLIGGGDSAAAAVALGFSENDFGFISTGGGASLEFIEGSPLPGIEAIQNKE